MKKLLNLLKYLLLLGLAVGIMWYALRGISFGLVLEQLSEVNYFWLGLSLALMAGSYLSRAYRWRMQLIPLGFQISLRSVASALMIGYLSNLVLPRMGEVMRCSILRRNYGLPINASFGTVITERVLDLVMLLLLIGLVFLLEFERLSGFLWGLFSDRIGSVTWSAQQLYLAGGIIVLLVGAGVGLLIIFLARLRQIAFFNRAEELLRGLVAGVLSIRKLETKGEFLLHTLLIWGGYFLATYLVLFALPATAALGPAAALAIVAIGGLGMAAPVQGGIGVFHLLVSSTLLLYGLSRESGMAFALLLHTSQTLLVALMGGIGFLVSLSRPAFRPASPVSHKQPIHDLNR